MKKRMRKWWKKTERGGKEKLLCKEDVLLDVFFLRPIESAALAACNRYALRKLKQYMDVGLLNIRKEDRYLNILENKKIKIYI